MVGWPGSDFLMSMELDGYFKTTRPARATLIHFGYNLIPFVICLGVSTGRNLRWPHLSKLEARGSLLCAHNTPAKEQNSPYFERVRRARVVPGLGCTLPVFSCLFFFLPFLFL